MHDIIKRIVIVGNDFKHYFVRFTKREPMKKFFTLPGEPETVALTEKAEQTIWNETSNYQKYIVITPAGELSGYLYKDGDRFIISDDQERQKIINAGDIIELWRVLAVTNKSPDDLPGLPVV